MKGRLLILSCDTTFARMLELEARMMNLEARACNAYEGDSADVILCDLDSVRPTPTMGAGCLIGFTRRFELSVVDPERCCAMILHRPFEMRMLREELLSLLATQGDASANARAALRWDGNVLICNGVRLSLSQTERAIMKALMENRGEPVSRQALASVIGESAGNKADVYVCYLRRKLATASQTPVIRTVRGRGYCIAEIG